MSVAAPPPSSSSLNKAWRLLTSPVNPGLQDPERALKLFRKEVTNSPASPSAWTGLGAACELTARYQAASRAYARASTLTTDPVNLEALACRRALMHLANNEPREAELVLDETSTTATCDEARSAARAEARRLRALRAVSGGCATSENTGEATPFAPSTNANVVACSYVDAGDDAAAAAHAPNEAVQRYRALVRARKHYLTASHVAPWLAASYDGAARVTVAARTFRQQRSGAADDDDSAARLAAAALRLSGCAGGVGRWTLLLAALTNDSSSASILHQLRRTEAVASAELRAANEAPLPTAVSAAWTALAACYATAGAQSEHVDALAEARAAAPAPAPWCAMVTAALIKGDGHAAAVAARRAVALGADDTISLALAASPDSAPVFGDALGGPAASREARRALVAASRLATWLSPGTAKTAQEKELARHAVHVLALALERVGCTRQAAARHAEVERLANNEGDDKLARIAAEGSSRCASVLCAAGSEAEIEARKRLSAGEPALAAAIAPWLAPKGSHDGTLGAAARVALSGYEANRDRARLATVAFRYPWIAARSVAAL